MFVPPQLRRQVLKRVIGKFSFLTSELTISIIPRVDPSYCSKRPEWELGQPLEKFYYMRPITGVPDFEFTPDPELPDKWARQLGEHWTAKLCPGNRKCKVVKDDQGEEVCSRCCFLKRWQKRTEVGDGPAEAKIDLAKGVYMHLPPILMWTLGRRRGAARRPCCRH